MDPSREMQLRRVLHERGDEYIGRFGELKYLLAPYVVTSAAEQRRFYGLWDDYVADLEKRTEGEKQAPVDQQAGPTPLWKNILWGLVVALLAFLVGWFIWQMFTPDDEKSTAVNVSAGLEAEVRAGQPLQVFNRTLLENSQDSVGFSWEIADAGAGEVLYRRDSFEQDYLVPADFTGRKLRVVLRAIGAAGGGADTLELAVLCADPPLLLRGEVNNEPVVLGDKRTFSVAAEDSVLYSWVIDGDTLAGPRVQYEFLTEGQSRVQTIARRTEDGDYCFTISRPQTIQVGTNLPEIPIIPLKRDIPRQLLTVSELLYLLPILFFGYLYWLHYRRWKKQAEENREKTDEELAEEYPFHDVGPYVIPYRDQSGQITVPADFYRIADQLRVREESQRMTFDGRATVEATIKEGGFPAWRERAVKRPVTYLVILRHTDEYQQQDRLLKRLTDFLTAREASLEVYYHGGDFAWFWNETHLKGWSAAQLRSRYGEHRLIVLGDGHGLVDTLHRGQPRLTPNQERWLHGWARRLLLTTEPVTDWSYQEVLLHEHFLLFPATTNGILRGVADLNQVEEYQAGGYPRWRDERLRRDPEPSYRYRTWDDVADHREYLADDPDLFRWLTALAVAPHPDWSLTIAVGRALGLDVTHDRLLRLSRIPWLATNAPDQDLRLDFLALLAPADEQLARTALLEQLELVTNEVSGTFAQSEWMATQAVQAFALAPKDAGAQGKIKELQRIGLLAPDQLDELDLVASREFPATKGGYQPTEDGTPAYLDKLLNPPPEMGPRFTDKEKELLGMIVGCFLLFLPLYLYDKAGYELETGGTPAWWQDVVNPTDDEQRAIEANNRAVLLSDYLAASENLTEYNRRRGQSENLLFGALDTALNLKDNYYLADSNKIAASLNYQANRLNWLVKDSLRLLPVNQAAMEPELRDFHGTVASTYGDSSGFSLQALHTLGLYYWWNYRQGSVDVDNDTIARQRLTAARVIEGQIDSLDAGYFDGLEAAMPIHLRYLLGKEPPPLVDFGDRVYNGRTVDQNGNPLSGVDIALAGSERKVVTAAGGNFRINPQLAKGALLFSYRNGPEIEVSLLDAERVPLENTDLGDVVVNRPNEQAPGLDPTQSPAQQQPQPPTSTTPEEDENNRLLETLIDNFSRTRYSRTLQQTGSAVESAAFANELTNTLSARRGVLRPMVKGDDLIKGGTLVTNGKNHDERGTFLFIEPRPTTGTIGDKVDQLHRGSRALIVESIDLAGNDLALPELTEVGNANDRFAEVLQENGFSVTRLKNPTKDELDDAFLSLGNSAYEPTSQLLVYLSGIHNEGNFTILNYLRTLFEGSVNEKLSISLNKLDEVVPHLLVIKNYTDLPQTGGISTGENVLPDMVSVPGGTFEMGDTFGDSDDEENLNREKPVHTVTVSPYEMGKYEVTFAEYDRFTEATGKAQAKAEFGRGQQPVINVSWFDAISYCNWLSKIAEHRPVYSLANRKKQSQWEAQDYGLELADDEEIVIDWSANGYRLPTEAEWEFAASYVDGKRKARFGNGQDTLRPKEANFKASEDFKEDYSEIGEYMERTVVVGNYKISNRLGIFDLAGNVSEFCADWYGKEFYGESNDSRNPHGPNNGSFRVQRGGTWSTSPDVCRSTHNLGVRPYVRYWSHGFRLARSLR